MIEDEVLEFFGGEDAIRQRIHTTLTSEISQMPDEEKDRVIEILGEPEEKTKAEPQS